MAMTIATGTIATISAAEMIGREGELTLIQGDADRQCTHRQSIE